MPDDKTPDEAVFLPGRNVLLLAKPLVWCHLNKVPELALAPLGSNPFADATAEFFTAITGLGAMIVKYGNQYDTASMFVPILILMVMGVTLTAFVRRIEEMFAPWRAQDD